MSRVVDWIVNGQINVKMIVRMLALGRGRLLNGVRMPVTVGVMRMGNLQVEMPGLANASLQAPHPTEQNQSSH
tara:strand:+ start:168 stop:386 length:219 start_codon:yes stop_codon:yes gene_type:complete